MPGLPAASLGSNLSWTNLTVVGGPAPSPRFGAAVVYDPALTGVLLFGGSTPTVTANDTWLWQDGTWTDLTPTLSAAPSPRYDTTVAYDSALNAIVLFGGYSGSTHLNDTWLFANGAWSNVTPAVSPPAREDASMAYDPVENYVVLFGGELQSGAVANDTWSFANGAWTNRTASVAPSPREAASMAYDPAISATLLFGGVLPYVHALNDTWEYSQGQWTDLTGSVGTAPPAREKAAMAYDPEESAVLLFDGARSSTALDSEWLFAGGQWIAFSPALAPAARSDAGLAWTPNSGTGLLLLFGGANASMRYNDTWGLRPTLTVTLSASPSALDVGQASNVSAIVSGGYPPAILGWAGLPGGCTPSASYANCTYSIAGTYDVVVTATDHEMQVVNSAPATVTVNPTLLLTATVLPTTGAAPLSVTFTASTSGGTSPIAWLWTFGDGSSSTSASGTHTYASAGNFSVNVTATDATSVTAKQSFSVTVSPAAIAPLTAQVVATPSSGSAPLNVSFSGSASGGTAPYAYAWTFGGGASASGPSVHHVFTAAGTYTATLTVTDALGNTTTATADVAVGPALSAVGHSTASSACVSGSADENVTYTVTISGGTAPYEVHWDLGSGIAPVTGLEANHTYSVTGQYSAEATITDAVGHSVVVVVNATGPSPASCSVGGQSSQGSLWSSYLWWGLLVLLAAVVVAVVVYWRRGSRKA